MLEETNRRTVKLPALDARTSLRRGAGRANASTLIAMRIGLHADGVFFGELCQVVGERFFIF